MKAFYLTRKAMIEVLQLPKQCLRPATTLEALIPETDRAQVWRLIRDANSLAMPDVETTWVIYGNRYPSGFKDLGDLAARVMILNHKKLAADLRGWASGDVWKTLCAIIVDQLGVRPEELVPDAQFLRDLKVS